MFHGFIISLFRGSQGRRAAQGPQQTFKIELIPNYKLFQRAYPYTGPTTIVGKIVEMKLSSLRLLSFTIIISGD